MSIESPHNNPQRDLFEGEGSETMNFSALGEKFLSLTGYQASAYGFVSEATDIERLRAFIDELETLSPAGRTSRLIGLATELDAGQDWWRK